uniref:Ig-like domain-containing protein n=1 Tax=Periophthalmus magnuspinnatus TaxID=409849 RepID=A0A3B4AKJ9_9GOBI
VIHTWLSNPLLFIFLHLQSSKCSVPPCDVLVGGSVTLQCYYNSTQVASHYSWYRQEGQNHLHITNVQPQDMALYFCGSSHNNIVEFGEGIFLNSISKHVTQEPTLALAVPGSSVTLNCSVRPGTCTEDHSVYWLKQGSELGLLHTHGSRCKPHGPKSGAQSCRYHLQKHSVSKGDAGTYYCAVASCGEVLFGNGTVLQVSDPNDVHIVVLVWLSIVRTGVLLLLISMCLLVYCIRST